MFDEIEPTGRIRHTGGHQLVVNGSSGAGFGFAAEVLRVELDRDKVSASSRRVEPHRHRVAALPDRPLQGNTVGVKHVAPIHNGREETVEVAGRDRLSDPEGVVASWRRHRHPVQEITGDDPVDQIVVEIVLHGKKSLGGAGRELATSRSHGGELTYWALA